MSEVTVRTHSQAPPSDLVVDAAALPASGPSRALPAGRFASFRRGAHATRTRDALLSLGGVLAFLFVWHVAVKTEVVSPLSVPVPSRAGARAIDLLTGRTLYTQLWDTVRTWLLSLLVTTAVMVPIGLCIGFITWLYRPATAVIHAARSAPSTALIPVAIVFFGLGGQMKFAVIFYSIAWPLCLQAMYGVRSVDRTMVMVARSLRWSSLQIMRRVVLPAAMPSVATGVRIAGSTALVVCISVEFLGARSGLGTLIVQFRQTNQPDFVFAAILIVGTLGVMQYMLMAFIEKRVMHWTPAHR